MSALLDGQLPPAEAERAWEHVEQCPTCHAEVGRQGWVKTRLAGLCLGAEPDAGDLKTALLAAGPPPSGQQLLGMTGAPRTVRRPRAGLAALGTGAAGVVALGMLAVVAPPADAPNLDRRQPPTVRPADGVRPVGTLPSRTGAQP